MIFLLVCCDNVRIVQSRVKVGFYAVDALILPVACACVCWRKMCSFSLSPPSADLFMNLGNCCFEVKPGDAAEKEANGDKTPPIGLLGRTAARTGTTIITTTPRGSSC